MLNEKFTIAVGINYCLLSNRVVLRAMSAIG